MNIINRVENHKKVKKNYCKNDGNSPIIIHAGSLAKVVRQMTANHSSTVRLRQEPPNNKP